MNAADEPAANVSKEGQRNGGAREWGDGWLARSLSLSAFLCPPIPLPKQLAHLARVMTVGDFFASCFGRRSEVISLPVIVEDADSYNFWHMPFRNQGQGALRGHGAGRTHAESGMIRRGGRENLY